MRIGSKRSPVLLGGILLIFAVAIGSAAVGLNALTNPAPSPSPNSVAQKAPCPQAPAGHPNLRPVRRYTRPVFNLLDPTQQWVATICTDRGVITMKLRAKDSPQATANFAFLARAGFYDGLSFHRVCPNKSDPSCGGTLAIAQGGDPKGDGSGGPGYNIKDEVPVGGYTAGTVAMAKTSAPNSAGSQFFIDTGDNSFPPNYAIFGDITFGLDVAKLLKKGDHIVWIDVSLASAPSPSAQPLLPGAPTPSPTPAASPS